MAGLEGGLDLGAEHFLFFSANMSQLFHLGFPHPRVPKQAHRSRPTEPGSKSMARERQPVTRTAHLAGAAERQPREQSEDQPTGPWPHRRQRLRGTWRVLSWRVWHVPLVHMHQCQSAMSALYKSLRTSDPSNPCRLKVLGVWWQGMLGHCPASRHVFLDQCDSDIVTTLAFVLKLLEREHAPT